MDPKGIQLRRTGMRIMRKKWVKIVAITVLILLPIISGAIYRKSAHILYKRLVYPAEIKVATGSEKGRYHPVSNTLVKEINDSDLGVHAEGLLSDGSLDNLRRLRDGEVHFALYQPDTAKMLAPAEVDSFSHIAFVANLYSQPVHLIVRRGAGIERPADLRGKTVQLGTMTSGDYAMSLMLLEHFGLTEEDLTPRHLDYPQTALGFADGTLDAAMITVGVHADIFGEVLASGTCTLLPIPNREALTWNRVAISKFRIPKGLYGKEPSQDIETVALGAQLITRDDVPDGLVKEVTSLVLAEDHLKKNNLRELFLDPEFARERPGFTIHPGARSYYDPEMDIHIFEALDAMYSLVASILIAAFLLIRALRKRRALSKEHRLDRYMHNLLKIEQEQVSLDSSRSSDDMDVLQTLLDEVTNLRQEALKELTAHELNEEPAANSFLEMCHALSEKINSKMSRQRMDQGIQGLTNVVQKLLVARSARGDANAAPEE
jgi:TRAP transporter TAXI family solute receptor